MQYKTKTVLRANCISCLTGSQPLSNLVGVGRCFIAYLSTTCSGGAFRITWCPSCVIRRVLSTVSLNIFSSQTAAPIWTKIGRKCSVGDPLQKQLTEFDFIKNSGCHCNEMEYFKQFFKNFLLWNRLSNFEIISKECSLGDPLQKSFAKF